MITAYPRCKETGLNVGKTHNDPKVAARHSPYAKGENQGEPLVNVDRA